MGLMGFLYFMSHEPMFQILVQFDEEIQSYWPAKLGIEFGH